MEAVGAFEVRGSRRSLGSRGSLVNLSPRGSNGAPMGEMGENNLGVFLDFSCIFNNMLWYFWGFNYSQMAN